MKEDDIQAFPMPGKDMWNQDEQGMTLRDYFAAKALQGLVSNPKYFSCEQGMIVEEKIFKRAYSMADAMLKARKL